MQDDSTHSYPPKVTQVVFGREAAPWSEDELARMRHCAKRRCLSKDLEQLFPDRTLAAIKMQLWKTREGLGIKMNKRRPPGTKPLAAARLTMLAPDDPGSADPDFTRFCKSTARSSAAMIEALARAGFANAA